MTPLPKPLGAGGLRLWRLDRKRHAPTWQSGEGSFQAGGRWNSPGVRAVYASTDPATAILEVAVHKGFAALDTDAHVMTSAEVDLSDPGAFHVINGAEDLPNANWLAPGIPSAGQMAHGDGLLRRHVFLIVPSVVSRESWNIVFLEENAAGHYRDVRQEDFALDPRLNVRGG